MTDRGSKSALQDVYDELADELSRVARAEQPSRLRILRRRSVLAALAAFTIGGGTAALGIAGQLPGGEPEPRLLTNATPLFGSGSEFPDCPAEVRSLFFKLDKLSDYTRTAGYPVSGCPTLEVVKENEAFVNEFNAWKLRDDSQGALRSASD